MVFINIMEQQKILIVLSYLLLVAFSLAFFLIRLEKIKYFKWSHNDFKVALPTVHNLIIRSNSFVPNYFTYS